MTRTIDEGSIDVFIPSPNCILDGMCHLSLSVVDQSPVQQINDCNTLSRSDSQVPSPSGGISVTELAKSVPSSLDTALTVDGRTRPRAVIQKNACANMVDF